MEIRISNRTFFVLFIVLVSCLLLLRQVHISSDSFKFKEVKRGDPINVNYDSRSRDSALSAIKDFSESVKSEYKEVEISFDARLYSVHNWQDIFQTAPSNTGIRMEIAEPAILSLVVGTKNLDGYRGFLITDSLRLNKQYSVRVLIDINKHLKVWLDNQVVLDIIDPNFHFDISEIAVGSGYSKTRPFDGELTNFKIKYELIEENKKNHLTITVIKTILIFCVAVISLFILLGINQSIRESIKTNQKRAILVLSIVLIIDVVMLALVIDKNKLEYRKTGSSKYANINYDSRSKDRELAAVKKYKESIISDALDMNIRFKMKAYSISEWNNIFQSAPVNTGIRMELSKPSTLSLLIGSRDSAIFKAFDLTKILTLNEWHKVEIDIQKNNNLKILFDGEPVVSTLLGNIDFDVSDIAIGTGFSRMRDFDGELSDVEIKYELFQKAAISTIFLLSSLRILAMFLFIIIPYHVIVSYLPD